MYAIIRAGGKQAKVKTGDVLEIERVKDGSDALTFIPLLVVGDDGKTVSDRAILSDAKVVAEVMGETQGDKIDIFKYKNKTGYRRHMGHRQKYTQIRVTSIDVPGVAKTSKPIATDSDRPAKMTEPVVPVARSSAAPKVTAPLKEKAVAPKAAPAARVRTAKKAAAKAAKPAAKSAKKATAATKSKAATKSTARATKKPVKRPTKKR